MNIMKRKPTRRVLKIATIILCIVVMLPVINGLFTIYESLQYKKPGQMVETDHGKMHVYTSLRNEGETYVFLTALGGNSAYYDLKPIWGPLSKNASVVVIDYLGYGMSEKTKSERTLDNIVSEIDTVLTTVGAKGPYTFIPHSVGGFYATGYTLSHPAKVRALLCIDNTSPEGAVDDPSDLDYMLSLKGPVAFKRFVGLNRFGESNTIPGLTDQENKAANFYENRMMLNNTVINEINHCVENANALVGKMVPDTIPMLLMVSEGINNISIEKKSPITWREYHELILNGNSASTLKMFETSHYIHWEQPNEVTQTILDFMAALQDTPVE